MAKGTKKRLVGCRERGETILTILIGKKGTADVTEFSNTIKFVNSVLDDYLKSKDKERPKIEDEGVKVEQLMKTYDDMLVQLVNTGRFLRFFTSNRVRKNLDQINTQLHKEVSQIFLGLQENKRKSVTGKRGTVKGLTKVEMQTECIKDVDGRNMWETAFNQTLMVEWPEFIAVLRKHIAISEDAEKQLRYVLDNSNTGAVSMYKFADFLAGLGPMNLCVEKVQAILNADWFHGFLSSVEAERLLERQVPGTFLIRFSKSKPGSFAIAYVDSQNKNSITHTLINCCPPSGFKIEEAYNSNARGRLFVTLNEVVQFYGYILKSPFRSDLAKQSWFHGDLSSQEAEEILAKEAEGVFLFRFSSKPGFLAVSYMKNGEVKHGLLESLVGGYKFDNQPPVYPTLQDVVTNLPEFLKTPLTNLTFDIKAGTDWSKTIGSMGKSGGAASPIRDENYTSFGALVRNPPAAVAPRPVSGAYGQGSTPPYSPPTPVVVGGSPTSSDSGYGSMPYPKQEQPTSAYGSMTSSGPSRGPPPSGVEPSNLQYGSMPHQPAQSGPSEYTSMPGDRPESQYGSLTVGASSGHASVSSEYESMPKSGVARQSVPPTGNANGGQQYGVMPKPAGPAPPGGNTYGVMPKPGEKQTLSPARPALVPNARPSSGPNRPISPAPPASATYGQMPKSGGNAPDSSGTYGQMPKPGGSALDSGHYGQAPKIGGNALDSSSSGNYGQMPKAGGGSPTAPSAPGNYGQMPKPGNGTAPFLTKPTTAPGADRSGSQYGRISLAAKSSTPIGANRLSAAPGSVGEGAYGRMPPSSNGPSPAGPRPVSVPAKGASPPPGNNPGSNYGKFPNPNIATANRALNTKSTSFPASSAPTQGSPQPGGSYGRIPPPTKQAASTPPANGTYGQMPTGGLGGQPTKQSSPLARQYTPSNYGRISMNPASESDYSGLPQMTQGGKIPNNGYAPESDYGGLVAPESDYGGLPSDGFGAQMSDDYGGLPVGGPQQQTESDYGGLPVGPNGTLLGHQAPRLNPHGSAESDYGGLPTNAMIR